MYASVLSPPNSHLLRDAVITGVVQCTRRANRISYHPAEFKPVERKASRDFKNNEEGSESQVPIPVSKISLNNKRKIADTTGITRFKRLKTASHEEKQKAIAELLEISERVKRERRQIVQLRYRTKQKRYAASVEKAIQELRQEIQILGQHRQCLSTVTSAKNAVLKSVAQYFRLICHEFQSSDQVASLREAMAQDVVYNSEFGFEAIAQSWYVMQLFDDVVMKLTNLSKSGGNSITVTTTTSVTLTEQTLLHVFPQLFNSKSEEDGASLASKLQDQRMVMRGSTCFVWDAATKRIVSVVARSDMLTPVLRLLGSLEAVSRTFEKALVSPCFQLRPRR
ncbi:hypothetical protein F441_07438 [Phytophthora nicotianae CJ01A1]|uniref:BZIP domain-containing protein n=4 Tax=Phytophthora nicotianae TaxID=4792 RepID=W2XYA2_PHYNI|nr:hypothetical protein L915_16142 [Phytophthora nicotianae]ETL31050.1 hypothetical protein L916_16040 [Phytophthora nicotianae]ETO66149.1 hypothetical protein F444_16604 [Phytophthora nicotianae P1976]ETP18313.1 hypothetical protein F441_07438 [Phytophthora nicotianae CJ01A1]ETP27820.1 hypothetical protein F442_22896 [Phytophthora nicotianae P10297]